MGGFKIYLLRRGNSPRTVKQSLARLEVLLHHCPNFTETEIDRFIVSLMDAGHSKASLNKYIGTAKHYAQFKQLPFSGNIRRLKEDTKPKKTLSLSQIEEICNLETDRQRDWQQLYWKLVAYTGARPQEILNLQKQDINLSTQTIYIMQSKTCEGRQIPIAEPIQEDLETYLKKTEDTLFNVGYDTALKDFRVRCEHLGITGVSPYSLRHSFITRLLAARVPLFVVQLLVGHKKADTTRGYFHANSEMLREAILRDPLTASKAKPENKLKQIEEYIKLLVEEDERFDKSKIFQAIAKLHESIKK